ncbi:Inositol-pentakisphosphate 2-kinase [Trypanosoma melophagium]|uniref:Inositol-pentakisphosphate 2-kinase n=1 Tax=Trypanosoma melophagium TaxID=715481 RepID=UPI00351A9F2D|nr:Inositol-pentakisphosphate 2-kinase [Trypanosoma melophagium]
MRYLGAGGCSVVFALTEEEANEALAQYDVMQLPTPRSHLALRLTKVMISECTTSRHVLRDFVGFKYEIKLTESLRARCASAFPPLAEHCLTAVYAHLIPDFAISPSLLLEERDETRWFTVEIKPKGIWKRPQVVGIIVDDVEYYIHPVKLRQCRYSLMQFLKYERQNNGKIPSIFFESTYCPNQIFLGDEVSIAAALKHLNNNPSNNLKYFNLENFPGGLKESELNLLASALYQSGVFSILANLQLYGTDTICDWSVLDIELLYPWRKACDTSSVRWIVSNLNTSSLKDMSCTCQSNRGKQTQELKCNKMENTSYLIPPLSLEECVNRFYVSTTAKDASVLATLSIKKEEEDEEEGKGRKPITTCENIKFTKLKNSNGGFFMKMDSPTFSVGRIGVVDVDGKRHKPLSNYFQRDQEVLAAWERVKGGVQFSP